MEQNIQSLRYANAIYIFYQTQNYQRRAATAVNAVNDLFHAGKTSVLVNQICDTSPVQHTSAVEHICGSPKGYQRLSSGSCDG